MPSLITINSLEGILILKEDWSELMQNSNSGNIFVSWEWITIWWKHFGMNKTLNVIVVKEENEIIGIAPFMVRREVKKNIAMNCLTFIGYGEEGLATCPDHLDIIARRGFEDIVARMINQAILDNKSNWDVARFVDIQQDSIYYDELITDLSSREITYYAGVTNKSPYAKIPVERNEKKWRYYKRRIEKQYDIKLVNVEDIDDGMAIVKNMNISSAHRRQRGTSWSNAEFYNFHVDIAKGMIKENKLSVSLLYCNDIPVAMLYGFIHNRKYYLYSTGFDSDYAMFSVGEILIGMYLTYLFENSLATEFDFLRGDEEYKHKWTDICKEDKYLYFYSKTLKGIFMNFVENKYRKYFM